jgi:hypothetical protein
LGVDASIFDPNGEDLADGSDQEWWDGSDATVNLSAQATIAGNYTIEGEHYICYYDGSWELADPPYSSYSAYSAGTGPPTANGDSFAYGTTWNAGSYGNITISGFDLIGETPTVTDSGCGASSSTYLVSAWTTNYSSVTANLSVYPTLLLPCTVYISLLGWGAPGISLVPNAPSMVVIQDWTDSSYGYAIRQVQYQVNVGTTPAASMWICESATHTNWSCTQNLPTPTTNACGSNPTFTDSNGQFIDAWSLNSSTFTPTGCGYDTVDTWYLQASPQNIPMGVLTGYIHTNAISINTSVCSGPNCGMKAGTTIPKQ